MSQAIETSIAPSPVEILPAKVLLRAGHVQKSYRMGEAEVLVLKDVNLDIQAGEFIAIEGRSGSGKSTLLHVLAALEVIEAGRVEFDDLDYTRRPLPPPGANVALVIAMWTGLGLAILSLATIALWASLHSQLWGPVLQEKLLRVAWIATVVFGSVWLLRWTLLGRRFVAQFAGERRAAMLRNRQFGFVFQFYYLLPELNVLENAMLAPMIEHSWLAFRSRKSATRKRAIELLERLGLGHRLKHKSSQLSGGERQRVAIARALMNNPRILFADEPTGNLDAETGRQIMDVLEALHRDTAQTIVMVTHDRSLAREADRILVLENGVLQPVTNGSAI